MGNIYVYESDATDFACVGLVGALTPTECRHEEIGNGASELTLVHPVDEWGRYAALLPDRILRAPIPVRTCPEIVNGAIVTSFEVWTVKGTATKAQRTVYSKRSGGKAKKRLGAGARVLVTAKDETYRRYKIRYGGEITTDANSHLMVMVRGASGWISKDALDFVIAESAPATPAGIEQLEPAWPIRDQLFRIVEVKKSEAGDSVTATALRLFYDLRGNLTNYKNTGQLLAATALAGISDNLSVATEFEFFTDIVGSRTGVSWPRMNPVKALLDDSVGFCALWGAELVRDDWDVYCLSEAGLDRGVYIEYRKNLTGVDCSETIENIITRIIPVGQTKTGAELFLDGSIWVDSPYAASYAAPHIYYLKCENCKVSSSVSTALARARMREQAQAMFDKGCDLPVLSVSVDFVNLGDTEEYAQYRTLENVYLFDIVHIRHPRLGIDVSAKVVRHVWDCLNDRVLSVELGSVSGSLATATSAQSMVEARFAALQEEMAEMIGIAVEIQATKGAVLMNENPETVLSARVKRGAIDITDTIDASLFAWSRVSADTYGDAVWNAAHRGMKSVTIGAADVVYHAAFTCDVEEGVD